MRRYVSLKRWDLRCHGVNVQTFSLQIRLQIVVIPLFSFFLLFLLEVIMYFSSVSFLSSGPLGPVLVLQRVTSPFLHEHETEKCCSQLSSWFSSLLCRVVGCKWSAGFSCTPWLHLDSAAFYSFDGFNKRRKQITWDYSVSCFLTSCICVCTCGLWV